jgi:multicomponent Na+:H+ antiporter subunit E
MKTFVIHSILAGVASRALFHYLQWQETALAVAGIFLVIMLLLWLTAFIYSRSYFRKLPKAIGLVLFFLKELIVASIEVAYDVVTVHHMAEPGIIAYPLDARTDLEITILANIISLTPGTLSIDVSKDRSTLFIHALYIKGGQVEAFKQSIKIGFERRLLQLMR